MSTAERLLDSLRDLLYAWTQRFTWRSPSRSRSVRRGRGSRGPRIDMHALVDRHEGRRGRAASDDAGPTCERVTMHDHAVSQIYDRGETGAAEWPEDER